MNGSWFKFNNLELALGMALKFYTRVGEELKLKVRKFLVVNFYVCRRREKLVAGGFPPCWIRLQVYPRQPCTPMQPTPKPPVTFLRIHMNMSPTIINILLIKLFQTFSQPVRNFVSLFYAFALTISRLGTVWFCINQLSIINTQSPSWFTWMISMDTNIMQ